MRVSPILPLGGNVKNILTTEQMAKASGIIEKLTGLHVDPNALKLKTEEARVDDPGTLFIPEDKTLIFYPNRLEQIANILWNNFTFNTKLTRSQVKALFYNAAMLDRVTSAAHHATDPTSFERKISLDNDIEQLDRQISQKKGELAAKNPQWQTSKKQWPDRTELRLLKAQREQLADEALTLSGAVGGVGLFGMILALRDIFPREVIPLTRIGTERVAVQSLKLIETVVEIKGNVKQGVKFFIGNPPETTLDLRDKDFKSYLQRYNRQLRTKLTLITRGSSREATFDKDSIPYFWDRLFP